MTRQILILPLLLLFMLPVLSFAATNGEAPLTLLNKPAKTPQTAQNQNIPFQDNKLHDIHGPVPIAEQPPYLLLGCIFLVVLLIAAAIFWFIKKKGKATPPAISPWEKALQDLTDAKNLLSPERALAYMDRASQILRQYIEARFAIQSTRQTTREFLQGLTTIGGNSPLQAHKTELQECLEQADMAKFAHHHPALKNLQQMEVAVTAFIKKTEPVETPKAARSAKQTKRAKHNKRGRS